MFRRIRDHLIDRLAALVWEGLCRLALSPEPGLVKAGLLRKVMMGTRQSVAIRLGVGKTKGAIADLRHVEFQGEQLAQAQSSVANFRIQKVLYRTQDGKLLVHVKMLEKSEGFPTTYSLLSVEETDLALGGVHEELGKAWGTLSLAEALGENR